MEIQEILSGLKKLEKNLNNLDVKDFKGNEKFENLKDAINYVKNWKLNLLYNPQEEYYFLPYVSKLAKLLMENFYAFEAKHSYEGLNSGLKISKMTHHSFCNVPVVANAVKDTQHRTDNIVFYPVTKIETEKEYTFLKLGEKKDKYVLEILKIYEDLALRNILLYKKEKIEIKKKLVNIPENLKDIDLATIKAQAIAVSKEETKNKVKPKDKTALYIEEYPVDNYEILSECRIIKDKDSIKAEIYDEFGNVYEYENLYLERPVAFTIFGIGYEKEEEWFPAAMQVNIFKRKDILSKKSSVDEYMEKHTYHLNGKKLQVNYKNLYLKGIYGIDKIPSIWSYASITANNGKLNTTIPIPVQRKVKDKETGKFKWQRTKPSSIAKAVYQILRTENINYKGEDIYLPGKRMFIEKELIDIEEPKWIYEAKEIVNSAVKAYRILQSIKRGLDLVENNVEDKEDLQDKIEVKEIVNTAKDS